MPAKDRTSRILRSAGAELRDNPPAILARTRRKKGAKVAQRQRVAILLSKARARGANIPAA